jgi:hypothetical protein
MAHHELCFDSRTWQRCREHQRGLRSRHRYQIRCRVLISLSGFESWRVDGEGVERTAGALNPYARYCREPFAV